jgi:hypothetical protein
VVERNLLQRAQIKEFLGNFYFSNIQNAKPFGFLCIATVMDGTV